MAVKSTDAIRRNRNLPSIKHLPNASIHKINPTREGATREKLTSGLDTCATQASVLSAAELEFGIFYDSLNRIVGRCSLIGDSAYLFWLSAADCSLLGRKDTSILPACNPMRNSNSNLNTSFSETLILWKRVRDCLSIAWVLRIACHSLKDGSINVRQTSLVI